MTTKDWFEIDKDGLARVVERRGGVARALLELVQNAWDTDATRVDITAEQEVGHGGRIVFRVTDDDPNGFAFIEHAYTMFAKSTKGLDATKRGRFNLGEKLALAISSEAEVRTKGRTVRFDADGRHVVRGGTEIGSSVTLWIKPRVVDLHDVLVAMRSLIPPKNVITTLNGKTLDEGLVLVRTFTATLPTEIADAEGVLRRSARQCDVSVYRPRMDDDPMIFEMGIPVVEFSGGEPFHVDVGQRVPLNVERDNVTPAYLRAIRAAVFNAVHDALPKDAMSASWVSDATASKDATPEAVKSMIVGRFGHGAVSIDPNDREANTMAASKGVTVIHSGSLSRDQWANVRAAALVKPSSVAYPTPRAEFSKDGVNIEVEEMDWTEGMRRTHAFSHHFAKSVLGYTVPVRFVRSTQPFIACFGRAVGLTWNAQDEWYERNTHGSLPGAELLATLVHEFAHNSAANHLSEDFHEAMGNIAAELARVAFVGALKWGEAVWGKKAVSS
jgi:hypothetical protein